MKIRLYKNSLRLRLTPGDVSQLQESGAVGEKTCFAGGSALEFILRLDTEISEVHASISEGVILVRVPRSSGLQWASGSEVALSQTQAIGDGGLLKILVEKDFECLHSAENEPNIEFYPNPRKA